MAQLPDVPDVSCLSCSDPVGYLFMLFRVKGRLSPGVLFRGGRGRKGKLVVRASR